MSAISDLVAVDFLLLVSLSLGELLELEEPPLEVEEDADDVVVDEATDSPSLLNFFR